MWKSLNFSSMGCGMRHKFKRHQRPVKLGLMPSNFVLQWTAKRNVDGAKPSSPRRNSVWRHPFVSCPLMKLGLTPVSSSNSSNEQFSMWTLMISDALSSGMHAIAVRWRHHLWYRTTFDKIVKMTKIYVSRIDSRQLRWCLWVIR